VKPKHIKTIVDTMRVKDSRKKGKLAPRTIRTVYSVAQAMFRDAQIEEAVSTTPCILYGKHLPEILDKNPEWRDTAVFERKEVETIISDARIPQDRRIYYALMFLGCMRFGEASALRWSNYEPEVEPLARLRVSRSYNTRDKREKATKAERPRRVPVHPVLAGLLAEWKGTGWKQFFGREPTPDDLVVPSRRMLNRSAYHMLKKFHADLKRLKLRERRQHDARRTWLSLVLADEANETFAKWIAHGPSKSVLHAYLTLPWAKLCTVAQRWTLTLPTECQASVTPTEAPRNP
jgi:integrase